MATTSQRLSAIEAAVTALKSADVSLGARIDKEVAARVTLGEALDARLDVIEGATPTPTPTPTPVPAPTPTPTPTPTTGPVRNFGPGTQAGDITASVADETWLLDPATILTGTVRAQAPGLTIRGGTVRSVVQEADRLTLDGVKFRGGAAPLVVMGRRGLHIMGGTDFRDSVETAIRLRIGPGGLLAGDIVMEDFAITHTGTPANGKGYSSISNERPDYNVLGGPKLGPITIRRYRQDQGVFGWGGIEVWDTKGLLVEDCYFKGRAGAGAGINAHMSIPRCFGAIVRHNSFDFTQGAWWGIEAVELNDMQFLANLGFGPAGGTMVQLHGGSALQCYRDIISDNDVRDIAVFVNQYGWDHQIVHNKLTNVPTIYRNWGNPGGNVTLAQNDSSVVLATPAGPRP